MTDKQQIEQLKEALLRYVGVYGKTQLQADGLYTTAKLMSKFGIVALPQNAVVLTRKEYDSLMGNIAKITKAWSRAMKGAERLHNIKLDLEHQLTQKGLTEYVGADVIQAETRKETAKEIFGEIYKLLNSIKKQDYEDSVPYYCADVEEFDDKLYILAKQLGVEVE